MAYSIIIMRKDRPDKSSKMFSLPRSVFWLIVVWFFFAPVGSFYATYFYIAPTFLVKEAGDLSKRLKNVNYALSDLRVENKRLLAENKRLSEESEQGRQQRAETETKIAIAENARITSASRQQELEDKVYELQQALGFYQEFVKPATTKNVLQCFNINITPTNNRLDYGINFLRNDQEKRDRINATVRFRLLTGDNVLNLEDSDGSESVAVEEISLTKDKRLKGKILAELPEEGLRILDIKAYDDENNVIAHCWKAF